MTYSKAVDINTRTDCRVIEHNNFRMCPRLVGAHETAEDEGGKCS